MKWMSGTRRVRGGELVPNTIEIQAKARKTGYCQRDAPYVSAVGARSPLPNPQQAAGGPQQRDECPPAQDEGGGASPLGDAAAVAGRLEQPQPAVQLLFRKRRRRCRWAGMGTPPFGPFLLLLLLRERQRLGRHHQQQHKKQVDEYVAEEQQRAAAVLRSCARKGSRHGGEAGVGGGATAPARMPPWMPRLRCATHAWRARLAACRHGGQHAVQAAHVTG